MTGDEPVAEGVEDSSPGWIRTRFERQSEGSAKRNLRTGLACIACVASLWVWLAVGGPGKRQPVGDDDWIFFLAIGMFGLVYGCGVATWGGAALRRDRVLRKELPRSALAAVVVTAFIWLLVGLRVWLNRG